MRIFKKAVSASGPIMRVLIGTGAFVLLVLGLKGKSGKDVKDAAVQGTAPEVKGADSLLLLFLLFARCL
jgi:hypothetical protein